MPLTSKRSRRFSKLCLALPLLLGVSTVLVRPVAAQVSITADITGTAPSASANTDITNALNQFSADFVPNIGTSAFHMTAAIEWKDLGYSVGSYTGGYSNAGTNSYQTHNDTLYINPLDRYLFGAASTVNTGSGYADFSIVLNSNPSVPWDYTLAIPSNFNDVSLATVLYHESIHSMGFAAFNNSDGNYDFRANGGAGSLAPTLWTTHLFDATTNQAFTADTLAERQAVMVSGDTNGDNGKLFFAGVDSEAENADSPVPMFAPSTFQPGSSDGSHIATEQQGAALLHYSITNGKYFTPSKLELAMMQDIGWRTLNSPAVPEASTTASFGLLLALGLGGFAVARRKSVKKSS